MNEFNTASDFIQYSRDAPCIASLSTAFQRALGNLGFRYFACASHVDPLNSRQAVMVINYPRAWVECYSERQLHRIDPVFHRAERTRDPFFWEELRSRGIAACQQRMLRNARQYGLADGYTIPIHGPVFSARTPASCSLVPDSNRVSEPSFLAAQLMAQYLFDRTAQLQRRSEPPPEVAPLCRRERQCLELAALGKTDRDIATVLGISQTTAHSYIESVKQRLGFHSRIQAVVYAAGTRQIAIGEVLRPLQRVVTVGCRIQRGVRLRCRD